MMAMAALKGNGIITLNKIKTITIMITDLGFILLYHTSSVIYSCMYEYIGNSISRQYF